MSRVRFRLNKFLFDSSNYLPLDYNSFHYVAQAGENQQDTAYSEKPPLIPDKFQGECTENETKNWIYRG